MHARRPAAEGRTAEDLAGIQRELADMRERLATLERERARAQQRAAGHRDPAERRLVVLLGDATEGSPFTAADVIIAAGELPELAAALRAADIEGAVQLGIFLKAVTRFSVSGVRVTMVDDVRGVKVWAVRPDE